jgi:hypothetical protein
VAGGQRNPFQKDVAWKPMGCWRWLSSKATTVRSDVAGYQKGDKHGEWDGDGAKADSTPKDARAKESGVVGSSNSIHNGFKNVG